MLYTDSGSPIPNDKPMEQFKASDEDWRSVEKLSEDFGDKIARTILELRDRVAALEAAPDRVPVRNQTGEYLGAGTPVYLAAPAKAVPSDEELWEVQWRARTLAQPEVPWVRWSVNDEFRPAHIASNRALYDCGYAAGLAAGRAEQQATTEPPTDPEPGDFQTMHGIALDMVDSLRPIVIPEILNVLRRAIREPMAQQQAAAEATPEPSPSQSDGWLIAALEGMGLDDATARRVLLIVARWLAQRCSSPDGKESRWLIDSILQILHEEADQ